jgi:hypothetical protein
MYEVEVLNVFRLHWMQDLCLHQTPIQLRVSAEKQELLLMAEEFYRTQTTVQTILNSLPNLVRKHFNISRCLKKGFYS